MAYKCPHCETTDRAAFYRNARRETGLSVLCKACHRTYEGTPDRRAKRTWNTLHQRIHKQPAYAHVEIRVTRAVFLRWAVPAYTRWMTAHPGRTPSLDRKDPDGHYEIGNLRIISRSENCRLARNHRNVHAPAGLAWCGGKCKAYLPRAKFQRCSTHYNGLQKRCRDCQNATVAAAKAARGPAASPGRRRST
jgi:hypothetical protein